MLLHWFNNQNSKRLCCWVSTTGVKLVLSSFRRKLCRAGEAQEPVGTGSPWASCLLHTALGPWRFSGTALFLLELIQILPTLTDDRKGNISHPQRAGWVVCSKSRKFSELKTLHCPENSSLWRCESTETTVSRHMVLTVPWPVKFLSLTHESNIFS